VAAKRARESRESLPWIKGMEGLPKNRKVVDVCDRGAETFEFLEHTVQSGRTFVVRSCYDRVMLPGHVGDAAEHGSLHAYARTLPAQATSTATVRLDREVLAQRRQAKREGSTESIQVLSTWQHGEPHPDWTVHEYTIALARLGGYRPRKDCPPGWQVLWRGQARLNMMLEGMRLAKQLSAKTARNGTRKCAKR